METVKGKPSLEDELQVHLDRISVIRKELSARENYKKESYKGKYFLIGKGRVFKIEKVLRVSEPNGVYIDCHGFMVSAENPELLAVDADAKERIDLGTHREISEGDFTLKVMDAIDLLKKATPMLTGIIGGTPDRIVSPLKDGRFALGGMIQRDWDMIDKGLREAGDKAFNKIKMDLSEKSPMVSNISKTLGELWKERFGQDLTDEKFAELAAMIPDQPKDPNQMEIDFEPKNNFDNLISWLLDKYDISYFHAENLLRRSKRVTLQGVTETYLVDIMGLKPRNNGNQGEDSKE